MSGPDDLADQPKPIDHGAIVTQDDMATIAAREIGTVTVEPAKPRSERAELVKQDTKGRYAGTKHLSEKGEKLARYLATGIPVVEAGRMAGYADADSSASRARRTPAVAARVLELQRLRLGRGVSLATKVIEDILLGKIAAPASVRLDAAKHVHKVSGVDVAADKSNEPKSLRDMSLADLEHMLAVWTAKTAPTAPGDDAQVIDVTAESVT